MEQHCITEHEQRLLRVKANEDLEAENKELRTQLAETRAKVDELRDALEEAMAYVPEHRPLWFRLKESLERKDA